MLCLVILSIPHPWKIPGRIAKSYSKCIFSFGRNYQTFPKWLYHFAFSPAMNESYCCFTSSSIFDVGVLDPRARNNNLTVLEGAKSEAALSFLLLYSQVDSQGQTKLTSRCVEYHRGKRRKGIYKGHFCILSTTVYHAIIFWQIKHYLINLLKYR